MPVRRLLRVAAVVVATLAAGEVAVRAIEDRLPPASGWVSDEYPAKRARMAELARAGGVEVVVLGSSVVDVAIDPAALSMPAYNAGLIAASPVIVETWARELAVPLLEPEVAVVGISSRDLNGNGAGMRARDEQFRASLGGAWLLGRHSAADRVEWWLNEHSALVRNRQALRRPLEALAGYDPPDRNRTQLTDLGLETELRDHAFRASGDIVEFFRREPLAGFDVTEDQLGAFRRLVAGLVADGLRVVVLDMPVTDDYVALHPDGAEDHRRYEEAVDEVVAATGAALLRPGVWPDELFADPLHLNAFGGERLTAELDALLRS